MGESDLRRMVLVVEDHTEHVQVIEQVLTKGAVDCDLVSTTTVKQANDFLHKRDRYTQAHRPDLILMNMHLSDGQAAALLRDIKTDTALRRIPTILLTPLADSAEIFQGYRLQGNCYVLKPQNLSQLNQVITAIESFWLNIVTLPAE